MPQPSGGKIAIQKVFFPILPPLSNASTTASKKKKKRKNATIVVDIKLFLLVETEDAR